MTLTLELTPEQEERLRQKAASAGLDAEHYALRVIGVDVDEEAELPKTPADAIEYWEKAGVYGLFADRVDTPELARELRKNAETRSRP